MINNWEIASRIDHRTREIHYVLLMDGTEHDARLIAKKLKGYVKEAVPAAAPYVYGFELPVDMDEGTQDKIHAAVQEGVDLANKVNQFVPGGVLGDPLFSSQTGKADKDFPTFLTLDPSASFFGGLLEATTPPLKQRNSIDLDAATRRELAHTQPFQARQISISEDLEQTQVHELDLSATAREVFATKPPQETLTPSTPSTGEKQETTDSSLTEETLPPPTQPTLQTTQQTILPEAARPFADETHLLRPAAAPQAKPEQPPLQTAEPKAPVDGAQSVSSVPAQPLQPQAAAQTPLPPEPLEKTKPQPEPAAPAAPFPAKELPSSTISISDSDMLIKDMEGSVLEKLPLKDILSAQTKYDMFVDVTRPAPSVQQAQQQKEDKIEQATSQQPAADPSQEPFNVFESDAPETNPALDVEEIQEITDKLSTKEIEPMKQPLPPQEPPQESAAAETFEQQTILPPSPSEQQVQDATSSVPFTLGSSAHLDPAQAPARPMDLPQEERLENTLPPADTQSREDLPEITIRSKTITLDKTFNLEAALPQTVAPQAPVPDQPGSTQPPSTKTILRPKNPLAENEIPEAGKTILRLRRKDNPPTPQVAQPLKSTMSPRNAEVLRQAKERAIDHSIQIPVSELKKHNWPLEVPLVPTYTLNNMVMSVNRFAHATAISVIENPGKLYNPLVLHGGTGTGKTHFLNALAYAFSQKFGQEHIFMTNGVRLSRGIQRYVLEGNIDKFSDFMKSVRALLIDDIHLLAINEQNRAFISQLLNSFLQEQKQIVITSKYPPESLEKLEELIRFKLDSGWISELKPATGVTRFRIVKKMLAENGVDLNDKQIEDFFSGAHMTLGTVTRSIRRLKVLENLIFPNATLEEEKSHAVIFEKLLATKGEDKTSELVNKYPSDITSLSTVGNGEWGRIGFFYPQNCTDMMNWMVYALQQRAKELHIEGGFDIVVRSSYSTENIISSAFKIANLCDNKKLKGAVILGPKPDTCDPSVRENFYDILTHMLEIMLIRCGIINYEDVRLPSTYVKVISELMR